MTLTLDMCRLALSEDLRILERNSLIHLVTLSGKEVFLYFMAGVTKMMKGEVAVQGHMVILR